jgi:Ni/Fe-hydrogenase subunit HybB-like protein
VLLGLVLNRFNTSLTFFAGAPYLPSFTELMVSVGYVCLGISLFDLAARFLPVFTGHASSESH